MTRARARERDKDERERARAREREETCRAGAGEVTRRVNSVWKSRETGTNFHLTTLQCVWRDDGGGGGGEEGTCVGR